MEWPNLKPNKKGRKKIIYNIIQNILTLIRKYLIIGQNNEKSLENDWAQRIDMAQYGPAGFNPPVSFVQPAPTLSERPTGQNWVTNYYSQVEPEWDICAGIVIIIVI